MLGGSSSINGMMYVRGHPGDFDSWAKDYGAAGWSYKDVLPYFRKSEGLVPSDYAYAVEEEAHGVKGSLKISVRKEAPLPWAKDFVSACAASGLPEIDYNGTVRGGPTGGGALTQFNIKDGVRQSTYESFLKSAEARPNLKIITGALASRLPVDRLCYTVC